MSIWVFVICLLVAIALSWVVGVIAVLDAWPTVILIDVGLIVLFFLFLWIRRWRIRRAAAQIEKELMSGAAKQVANTRPDRRHEIIAMQENMKRGIGALKGSGGNAMAVLPWVIIIGPPGAGKTTALKQSGLDFPVVADDGGPMRGVGGTKNCDWWFTSEAILIDTAGRWSTEGDDREEWMAFLDMLRRLRGKPINGVLVAISTTDLATATDEQIEAHGKNLRGRIDELMVRLQTVVPVYLLLTKADLIAGFVEFFGDLRKSERGQIFGFSFEVNKPKGWKAGDATAQEFEAMVASLHTRALKRIGAERAVEARPKIFQFPLEFALLKQNLSDLIDVLFRENPYQETPIFRGVYFTSGTQEGRPMERILGNMMQGFGLQAGPASEAPTEAKSYFVTDLFRRIVFRDKNVAVKKNFGRKGAFKA